MTDHNTIQYQTNGDPVPGMHADVPDTDYRAAPGVSKSMLDLVHQSPALVEWDEAAPEDEEASTAADLGTAFELALLEPDTFSRQYMVAPQVDKRTKQGKADWDAFVEHCEENGYTQLTYDQGRQIRLMVGSAHAHPMARRILTASKLVQPSYWAYDDVTGLLCKCRPDVALAEAPLVVDVKTSGQIERFANSVADLRYHVQDAYYTDMLTGWYGAAPTFCFLVVSTSLRLGRYPVHVYELTPQDREAGRLAYRGDLDRYADCVEARSFVDVEQLTRPGWAWKQEG